MSVRLCTKWWLWVQIPLFSLNNISTCKFPKQVYHCVKKYKYLRESFFQLTIAIKLKVDNKNFMKITFIKQTMILLAVQSISRILKRNRFSWVYLVNATNLSGFCCRKVSLWRRNAKSFNDKTWYYFFLPCMQYLQPYK